MRDIELLIINLPLEKFNDNQHVRLIESLMIQGFGSAEILKGYASKGINPSDDILKKAQTGANLWSYRGLETKIAKTYLGDQGYKDYLREKDKRRLDWDTLDIWRKEGDSNKFFYRTDPDDDYTDVSKTDLKAHLMDEPFNLRGEKLKGESLSEIARIINYVQKKHKVKHVFEEVAGLKKGITHNVIGQKFLCLDERKHIKEIKGNPSLIKNYFEKLTASDRIQFHYLMGWLYDFDSKLTNHQRTNGLVLALCGPTNIGKTFFIKVLGWILGQSIANGKPYLTGQDNFNKAWASSAIIYLDDAMLGNKITHTEFTGLIKNNFFGPETEIRGICENGIGISAVNRLVIATNIDGHSFKIIPALDASFDDKLLMIKAEEGAIPNMELGPDYWEDDVRNAEFQKCVPAFLYWLRNEWIATAPKEIFCAGRSFVHPYKDPELLEKYMQNNKFTQMAYYLSQLAPFHNLSIDQVFKEMKNHDNIDMDSLRKLTYNFDHASFGNLVKGIMDNVTYQKEAGIEVDKKMSNGAKYTVEVKNWEVNNNEKKLQEGLSEE